MKLNLHKTDFILIGVIILLSLVKLWHINGGLVLGEPDEWSHLEVARNFSFSLYPQYSGVPFYYSLPLYPLLGYLFSFALPAKFLALRIVSLLASLIISVGIYLYMRHKGNYWAGFWASIIFTLTPLSIFYSRIGLIDMTLTSLVFLSIITFDLATQKKSLKWGIFSGVFLGLSILSKYTALTFLGVIGLYLAVLFIKSFYQKGLTYWLKSWRSLKFPKIYRVVFLQFLTAAILVLPIVFIFALHSRHVFRDEFNYIFNFSSSAKGFFFPQIIENSPNLISPLTGVAFVVGLGVLLVKGYLRSYGLILLSFLVSFYIVGRVNLTPRYLVVLLPYISVMAGLGIYWFSTNINFKFSKIIMSVLLFLFFLPFVGQPFQASYHTTVKKVGEYVKSINKDNQWILTNYWPSIYIDETGSYKTTWLSSSIGDSQAFSTFPTSLYQKIDKPSLEVLMKEGGIVVLEDLYSKNLYNSSRAEGESYVKSRYTPVATFVDNQPNWPFFNTNSNKISVYQIKK